MRTKRKVIKAILAHQDVDDVPIENVLAWLDQRRSHTDARR